LKERGAISRGGRGRRPVARRSERTGREELFFSGSCRTEKETVGEAGRRGNRRERKGGKGKWGGRRGAARARTAQYIVQSGKGKLVGARKYHKRRMKRAGLKGKDKRRVAGGESAGVSRKKKKKNERKV